MMPEDLSDDAQLGGIGHNKPPKTPADKLRARQAELLAAGSQFLKLGKLKSQEQSDNLKAFRDQARALRDEAKATSTELVAPLKQKVLETQGEFVPIIDAAQLMLDKTQPMQIAWLEAVKKKQAEEAAERQRIVDEERARLERLTKKTTHDMGAMVAAQEQAKKVEEAEDAARLAASAKPRSGGQFAGPGGQKRSEGLTRAWDYAVRDRGKALDFLSRRAGDQIMLAFLRELDELLIKHARKAHAEDRERKISGIDIVEKYRV